MGSFFCFDYGVIKGIEGQRTDVDFGDAEGLVVVRVYAVRQTDVHDLVFGIYPDEGAGIA